ncbi:hypothetical protein FOC1_g10011093 [Fusarium oxysporum f. sp. cubense race 1]|uniref:Uncharacterized protein n=1 Tax=Fusarium oxysporum f. sp. cubense (strain race 1) TaxID=1229664 RepID=N4UUI1_FUSC1|nr:hypothetical protein FOC1_g10011093 [Fusarium oxysporum f. sp. cubense race 1]
MPIKDRTATHGYAERDITHHLSLSIRNGVYTNDAVKGSAHAAVHTYQSNMQGRCMAKKYSVKLRERLGELRGIILAKTPPILELHILLTAISSFEQVS